jgi:hypothetical protein
VTTATGSTWTWRAGIAGRLAVEAYWTSTSTRDPATVYEIRDGSALLASVTRDQRISGQWTSASALGTHQFVTGQASVTVRKASAGTASVVADAVRFTRVP